MKKNCHVFLLLIMTAFFVVDSAAQSVSTGHPATTFLFGGSPVVLAPSLTVTSSSTIEIAKISIGTNVVGDVLDAVVSGGFSKSWDNSTKVLTITGSGSASQYENILRTVTFSTTNTSSPRKIDFMVGNGVTLVIGGKQHFYQLVNNGSAISWANAKSAAASQTYNGETGYLATITSQTENDFLVSKITNNTWIGGSDDVSQGTTEGNWIWANGPEQGTMPYTNWAGGEPNNCCGGENYMHFWGTGDSFGKWNDFAGGTASGVQYYIIEFGGYSGSPASLGSDYVDVTITTNTPPVANNDTYNRFYTETGISFTVAAPGVLGNDTDGESDALTAVLNTGVSNASAFALNLNGSFSYTSTVNLKDFDDSFTYYANDGTVNSNSAATVTIHVLTPRFIGGGVNNNFSNPANWNCGYVPNESLNIIIAAGQTMVVDQDYTCKTLKFETGSSFNCELPHVLTITGDVFDKNGKIVIDVTSSLVVRSSIEIPNDAAATSGTFTDSRDSHVYNWVTIGTQVWMAENLAYDTDGGSWAYNDDPNNVATYGRLYDWNTAMNGAPSSNANPSGVQGVCPVGWHLPSVSEWSQLIESQGLPNDQKGAGLKETGTTHWNSPNVATNSSGFTALPGGKRDQTGVYSDIGESGNWWYTSEMSPLSSLGIYLFYNHGYATAGWNNKFYGFSVRCVKD